MKYEIASTINTVEQKRLEVIDRSKDSVSIIYKDVKTNQGKDLGTYRKDELKRLARSL